MTQIVQLSSKGQLVIPLSFRRALHLRPGSKMSLQDQKGAMVLQPLPKRPWEAYIGIFKGAGLEAERRAMKRRERRRDRKLGLR